MALHFNRIVSLLPKDNLQQAWLILGPIVLRKLFTPSFFPCRGGWPLPNMIDICSGIGDFFEKSSMWIVLYKICYCLLLILPLLVALHLNKHSFFPSGARFPAIFLHLYLSNLPKMCTIIKSCTVHFQSPTHV